ncbi:triose-phosphate isomerase [Candidatus Woesearchaeota archaeon]|nr:triose-phosphate isomerase [Candidatus Woesearchaeota archaeon]
MTPLIIVNFKTYKEATGENAVRLAKQCEAAAKKAKGKVKVAVAVQATDISKVAVAVDAKAIEVFAQHIDTAEQGKFTGFVTAAAVKEAGAVGTLVNHAEHKLGNAEAIAKHITAAQEKKLNTVVCAANWQEATAVAATKPAPDYIAIEPPELIGGKVSVSSAKPEVVLYSVAAVKKANNAIKVLCGAGINSGQDVKKALELGTEGILVASSVVLAKEPEKALAGLISGAEKAYNS